MKLIDLKEAKRLLEKGDVVAIPTETVYGLAGHIFSETGLKKIFAVKERPFFDPLIVHVETKDKAKLLVSEWTRAHDALADACWPGPLTLIAPKNEKISPLITAGLDSVGLRCPRHPETLKLLSQIDGGLAAPSANKFGKTSPTSAAHVFAEFGDDVAIIDGGVSDVGIESTVVGVKEVAGKFLVEIFRPGHFTASALKAILEAKNLPCEVRYAESPVAPGQLKHHYMPKIPLVILNDGKTWEASRERIETELNQKFLNPAVWHLPTDAKLASRVLYQNLRSFDQDGHDLILISRLPTHASEEWLGIWNRLEKAKSLSL